MSRTTHHRISLLALTALGLGAVLVPSAASAEAPQVLQLAKGIGGPDGLGKPLKNATPGTEQSVATAVAMGDKTYIVTVWMSGDVKGDDRPNELKCSSVEIDKMTGIKTVVDAKQLTTSDGNSNRPANHPSLATDGTNVVLVYGSDVGSANVKTYARVLNHLCEPQGNKIKISNDDDQNCGAAYIQYHANGHFLASYLRGGIDARAVGLSLTGTTLTKTFDKKVIAPGNIARPTTAVGGPDRALFCAAQGDQRPPEDGIACALINPIDGTIVVPSKIVAASNPNATPKLYMNQPTVAMLDQAKGIFAVNYQRTNGAGKNTNTKGANTQDLMIVQASDLGITIGSNKTALAASQTHASMCTGTFGITGERFVGVMGSPITGVGVPTMQFVQIDATAGVTNAAITGGTDKLWTIGFHGDAGHLSNIYGQNPKTQGRDFLSCIGDVPNPGYNVPGGFMENVATFFVAPHSGRITGEPKNALFLSLIPGQTKQPSPPTDPTEVMQGPNTSGSGSSSASSSSSGSGAGGSSGTNMEDPTGGNLNPGQPSGCACSVPGGDDSGDSGLALTLALGLALAVAARRKAS
jgi:MYXO-CTERM domain-containing protein